MRSIAMIEERRYNQVLAWNSMKMLAALSLTQSLTSGFYGLPWHILKTMVCLSSNCGHYQVSPCAAQLSLPAGNLRDYILLNCLCSLAILPRLLFDFVCRFI
jgi:hypothetical protein